MFEWVKSLWEKVKAWAVALWKNHLLEFFKRWIPVACMAIAYTFSTITGFGGSIAFVILSIPILVGGVFLFYWFKK
jgi:hypothetical protein